MGRCGWGVGAALVLAVLGASCGGTGGGPSDSGNQFVFTARGRLNLAVQTTSDPKKLILTATLLDPQGVPFRNQPIMFTAEFPDATFIPGNDNKGSVLTDDSSQASITLIAGLTIGKMRVIVEAPPALNISTGITVTLTEQGFVSVGPLGIIPSSVTFVNPAPHPPGGPADFTFQATGGDPPYKFSNSNPSVGKIETTGTAGSLGQYTLTGPLPIGKDKSEEREDTVRVQDARGATKTADVLVLFVTCALNLSPAGTVDKPGKINFNGARGGEKFDIAITNGVPPYTATHTFPAAGNLLINQQTNTVTYVVATPPLAVDPDSVLIRDSRGCTGTVNVTIVPAPAPKVTTIVLTANPVTINGIIGGTSTITATVLDEKNKPIQGVSVLFTDDNARATTDPLIATTDSSGRAVSTLKVPSLTPTGVIRVTGSAQGVSGFVDVTIVTRGGPAGPPANIAVDLFADRSGDNNDGTCTTILSALVVDAKGNPANDGTRVDLAASPATTTIGDTVAVSVTSPDFTNQEPPCDTSTYVRDSGLKITPQPGDALACLKYPRSASRGTTTITATAGSIPPRSFTITLPACPFVASGAPVISPSSVTLAPGESRTFIVVGGIPPYTIAASGGTVKPTQVAASGGSFTYTAGPQTGDFDIFATDTAGKRAQAKVTIAAASAKVAKIILVANPPSVNGVTGGTSTITASVFNENNQPIQGATVLFETTVGTVSPLTATTNASGQASTILTILPGTPAGVATVSGSAGGKTRSIDVNIVTSSSGPAGPPANIFVDLFANRSGDNNDGTCTTIVSALVVDAQGRPVNNGTQIDWSVVGSASVTSPSFTNQLPQCDISSYKRDSKLEITPQPGDALTYLKYPKNASGTVATVTATATRTAVSRSLPLNLPPCPFNARVLLQASPSSINGGPGGTSAITATVFNSSGLPLAGQPIIFSTTAGTLSATTVTTNASGQATTTLNILAGTAAGPVTVTGRIPTGGPDAAGTVVITIN